MISSSFLCTKRLILNLFSKNFLPNFNVSLNTKVTFFHLPYSAFLVFIKTNSLKFIENKNIEINNQIQGNLFILMSTSGSILLSHKNNL